MSPTATAPADTSLEDWNETLEAARADLLLAEERGDETARVDPETLRFLLRSGLLTSTLPSELGGAGVSLLSYTSRVAALARVAPSAALLGVMPSATIAIARLPEELVPAGERGAFRARRKKMADEALAGRIFGVANTEPGSGGDLKNTKTVAEVDSEGQTRLTGYKAFASFGAKADVWMCSARDDEGIVEAYLVSASAPGLTYVGNWDAVGMRGTESLAIQLQAAPAEDVLGYRGMLEGPNARHFSTLGFAAVFAGVARGAFDEARAVAGTSALADVKLVEVEARVEAAESLIESVSRVCETWPLPRGAKRRANLAKTFAAEAGVFAAETAVLLLGGRVYARAGRAARLLRDALAGPLLRPPLPLAYAELAKGLRR